METRWVELMRGWGWVETRVTDSGARGGVDHRSTSRALTRRARASFDDDDDSVIFIECVATADRVVERRYR